MSKAESPTKRQRRLGVRVIPKLDKYVARRPYPPGIHGPRRRRRQATDFGLQLAEKQKVKFIYGLRERQLKRIFAVNPAQLITNLERRLDNVIYRGSLARTRAQARQIVSHGSILVNNTKIAIPSYMTKKGDIIKPKNPSRMSLQEQEIPEWLKLDKKNKTIEVKKIPERDQITSEINEQLIVEFYSR